MMSKAMTKPIISLQGKGNVIHIGVGVLQLLGMPSFVCLYQTNNHCSIAIGACAEKNVMSFKVPERLLRGEHSDCRIHSKSFLDIVMPANHLDRQATYQFSGVYHEDRNLVTFQMGLEQAN